MYDNTYINKLYISAHVETPNTCKTWVYMCSYLVVFVGTTINEKNIHIKIYFVSTFMCKFLCRRVKRDSLCNSFLLIVASLLVSTAILVL